MKALHNTPLYQYLSTLQQPTKQREVVGFTVLRFYGFTVLRGNHKGMPLLATTKPAYDLQGKGITANCGLQTVKLFIGY
jgi:hypothetical protein